MAPLHTKQIKRATQMPIFPLGEKSFALISKDLTVSGWAVKRKSILFLKNWKEQQMRGETWKRWYSYCSSQMHGRNGMKRWAKLQPERIITIAGKILRCTSRSAINTRQKYHCPPALQFPKHSSGKYRL